MGETIAATRQVPRPADCPLPFLGGWIGYLGYNLGRALEPAARSPGAQQQPSSWPLYEMHRCPAAYIHDAVEGGWWRVGDAATVDSLPRLAVEGGAGLGGYELGPITSFSGPEAYQAAVARAVEHIAAGDIFQVNLAHRLRGGFSGSARACFAKLAAAAGPWYGAYVESASAGLDGQQRIIASISPELFLQVDGRTRQVITRPIKGTRRGDADPEELRSSEKDAAELVMIVDLMRNDLGRVAEAGSVRVDELRTLERHAAGAGDQRGTGVWHGVATVSAVLRDDVGLDRLLSATFPAGSITGAPKIRAMQIIEELEPVERGPYCGSIGYVSDCGNACFNVAIRTALLHGPGAQGSCDRIDDGALEYSVGAGIVADSDPAREWQETLDKAGVILALKRPVKA